MVNEHERKAIESKYGKGDYIVVKEFYFKSGKLLADEVSHLIRYGYEPVGSVTVVVGCSDDSEPTGIMFQAMIKTPIHNVLDPSPVFDIKASDLLCDTLCPPTTADDPTDFCFDIKDVHISKWTYHLVNVGRGVEKGIEVYHRPSDTAATCSDFKSEHCNRHMALVRLDKKLMKKFTKPTTGETNDQITIL